MSNVHDISLYIFTQCFYILGLIPDLLIYNVIYHEGRGYAYKYIIYLYHIIHIVGHFKVIQNEWTYIAHIDVCGIIYSQIQIWASRKEYICDFVRKYTYTYTTYGYVFE